jgi:hypothetical protein
MANNVVRMQGGMPQVGQRDGNWVWNGSNWVCDPGCDDGSGLPPFGPPVFSGPVGQPPWYPGANGGVSFGATAPPNPVRGHMWWDGTSFWLFDGAAWVAIGGAASSGGTATGPTPPASPFPGQMWFNGSVLYVWDGTAWVPTSTTRSFVQSTAPPSPNPGDLWFDGTQQRIWSGTAWVLVGPGATVGPVPTSTKVFEIQSPTAVTGVAAGWEIAPINGAPNININGNWNVTTKVWTPAVPGIYAFELLQWNANAGTMVIALLKNDAGGPISSMVNQPVVTLAEVTTSQWIAGSGMVTMNGTTDFVRLWSDVVAGGTFDQSYGLPVMRAFLLP